MWHRRRHNRPWRPERIRRPFVLFLLLAAARVTAESPDIGQALERLGALEGQIARVSRLHQAEQARLLEAGKALETNQSSLAGRGQLDAEARRSLESMRGNREADLDTVQRQLQDERQAVRDARRDARRTAALLAWKASRPAEDPRQLATLTLLERRYRERMQVATARVLRLEGRHSDAEDAVIQAADSERYYSTFQEYSLQQLRERQQGLVDEIALLQVAFDRQSGQLERLARQREELAGLVTRLTQPAESRATEPAPAIAPAPVVNPETGQRPTVAEAPYEDGNDPVPAVSLDVLGGGGTEAGPRRLFWHATPVTVRALAGGRVAFSGSFAGYRHLLIVDLGGGWHALYGNMTECTLGVGDAVRAGQGVGTYQAARGAKAEPFWIEARRGVAPVPLENWPALPPDWQERLFARATTSAAPAAPAVNR